MTNTNKQHRASLIGFFLCTCITSASHAAQNEYSIASTVQYATLKNPNNINGGNSIEESLRQLQIDAALARTTSQFTTDLKYSLSKQDYEKGLLGDRTLTTGSGFLLWTPIEDTFSWQLSNNRRLQVIDATLPTTQNNLEVSRITATGPILKLRLSGRDTASFDYSYATASTQSLAQSKQERNSFNLGLQHIVSTKFTTGISFSKLDVNVDSATLQNFDNQTIALNNSYNSAKYQIKFSLGYMESSSSLNSDFYNFEFNFIPLTSTTIKYTYEDRIEDQFSNLLQGVTNFGDSTSVIGSPALPQDLLNSGPLINAGGTTLGANLLQQYALKASTFQIGYQSNDIVHYQFEYSSRERKFASQLDSQQEDRLGLIIRLTLNNRLAVSLLGRDTDLDFAPVLRTQHRKELGLTAEWTLNTRFRLQLSATQIKQNGNTIPDTYDSNNIFLAFTYAFSNHK